MNKLSVIIPHYNSADKLKVLLQSIPQKEWIRIIVVDDHSAPQFKPENLCYFEQYKNVQFLNTPDGMKGPGMARNEGINKADTEWLIFADSDDFFLDGAFEILESYLNSNFDCIYFSPTSINIDNGSKSTRHEVSIKNIKNFLKDGNPKAFYKSYAPWCKMIRKSFLTQNKIEFDNGIGGEDFCFSLKVAFYSINLAANQFELYCITESNDSLTKTISPAILENIFSGASRYNDFLKKNDLSKEQAPMLGWIYRTVKSSPITGIKFLFVCIKKGYPLVSKEYINKAREKFIRK